MLTIHIDLHDGLVNWKLVTMIYIGADAQGKVSKIYIKFDDLKAGLNRMSSSDFATQHLWVPIRKREVKLLLKIRHQL